MAPTFTLNYGLRWDVDQPRYEVHGNTSNISLTTPNPTAGGLPGALVFAGKGPGRNGVVDETWANGLPQRFRTHLASPMRRACFPARPLFEADTGFCMAH